MSEAQNFSIKDIIKAEYEKCAKSPIYFMKKYVFIQTTSKGRSLFELYQFQSQLLNLFHTKDRLLILKSRQLGITTLCAGYALWLLIFKKDQSILALAPTQEKAKNIVDKVRFGYKNLPSWLREGSTEALEDNKLSLVLKNGSKIKAASGASDSARGITANVLILDEAAFIDNADELWGSAQQTLATGGQAIVLSTPNGVSNWFNKQWIDAELQDNDFIPVRLPWSLHPERNQAWRDAQDRELGAKLAAQECFEGDTRIYTKRGLIKISEIVVGDEVLSHTGVFRKVLNTMSHEVESGYTIHSSVNPIKRFVTENHPFLKENNWVPIAEIENKQMLPSVVNNKFLKEKIKYVSINNLIKSPFFKIVEDGEYFYVNDRKHKKRFPKIIELDYNLGLIVGLYLAEGSKVQNRVTFSFNYKTELNDWPADISDIIKKRFNIDAKIHKKNNNNGANLDFCSQIFSGLIGLLTEGNDCYSKKLSSLSYENMNMEYAKGVIDGIFKGDGCVLKKYKKGFTTTSINLLYDVKFILNGMGVYGLYINTKPEKIAKFNNRDLEYTTAKSYQIFLANSKDLDCVDKKISSIYDLREYPRIDKEIQKNGFIYNKLYKDISTENIKVYNIEVDVDHTYITEHFVVHNCDCDFLNSGDTYFDSDDLQYYRERIENPLLTRGANNDLWVWEEAAIGRTYMIVVDTSRGDSQDFSAIQVIDIFSGSQVAEFKGNIDTKLLSRMAVSLAIEYNNALLIVENTGIGQTTISDIIEMGYNNIYYSPKGDSSNVNEYIAKYYENDISKMTPGFTCSTKTRPLILHAFRQYVKEHSVIIRSSRTVSEMNSFIWKNGKPQSQYGYNDDLVIPYAIGLYLRDSAVQYRSDGIEVQKAVLSNFRKATPLAYRSEPSRTNDPYKMNINGQMEDISWLVL